MSLIFVSSLTRAPKIQILLLTDSQIEEMNKTFVSFLEVNRSFSVFNQRNFEIGETNDTVFKKQETCFLFEKKTTKQLSGQKFLSLSFFLLLF